MASPPFNINQSLPGDSDVVSQHPFNARAFRDIVESWLLVNHTDQGRHRYVSFANVGGTEQPSIPTALANVTHLYMDGLGYLRSVNSTSVDQYIGPPPGSIIFYAGGITPAGYLVADGSAVSRSTFSILFNVITTGYGPGDGSTTFNLPDLRGRVIAGEDNSSVHLSTTAYGSVPGQGAVSTANSGLLTLAMANLPASPAPVNAVTSGYTPNFNGTQVAGVTVGSAPNVFSPGGGNQLYQAGNFGTIAGFASLSVSSNSANLGSSVPISLVQPTIVLRALIKY